MNRLVPFTLAIIFAAAMPVAGFAQTPKQPGKHDTAKGAAAGAVIGHEAGGHAMTGAAAGAAIGHHEKHKAQSQGTNG